MRAYNREFAGTMIVFAIAGIALAFAAMCSTPSCTTTEDGQVAISWDTVQIELDLLEADIDQAKVLYPGKAEDLDKLEQARLHVSNAVDLIVAGGAPEDILGMLDKAALAVQALSDDEDVGLVAFGLGAAIRRIRAYMPKEE